MWAHCCPDSLRRFFLTVENLQSVKTSQGSFLWRLCHDGDISRSSIGLTDAQETIQLRAFGDRGFTNTPCQRLRSSDVAAVDCLDNEWPSNAAEWLNNVQGAIRAPIHIHTHSVEERRCPSLSAKHVETFGFCYLINHCCCYYYELL